MNALSEHVLEPQLPVCLCGGKIFPTEITKCSVLKPSFQDFGCILLFLKCMGLKIFFILHKVYQKKVNVINVFFRQNISVCQTIIFEAQRSSLIVLCTCSPVVLYR